MLATVPATGKQKTAQKRSALEMYEVEQSEVLIKIATDGHD